MQRYFRSFEKTLLGLASNVQEGVGRCAMPSARLKENVYDPIGSGELSYVTCDGMHNFAGETIGDWAARLTEMKVAWQLVLLPDFAMHVNLPSRCTWTVCAGGLCATFEALRR
jgi:hypothetical protein